MTTVIVEGSRTRPCTELSSGDRRTCLLTDRVQRLIDRGHFVVIATYDDPEPAAAVVDGAGTEHTGTLPTEVNDAASNTDADPSQNDAPTEPPAKNGSREAWAAWLDHKGVWFPDDAKRDDMVAAWGQVAQQQDAANE